MRVHHHLLLRPETICEHINKEVERGGGPEATAVTQMNEEETGETERRRSSGSFITQKKNKHHPGFILVSSAASKTDIIKQMFPGPHLYHLKKYKTV